MAYTTPPTFSSLAVLTAAQLTILGNNDVSFHDGTGLPSADSDSSSVAASQTSTSTSYTDLPTANAITVDVGQTGKLLINLGATLTSNDTNNAKTYMSFALSGANTLAAADNVAAVFQSPSANVVGSIDRTVLLTGLTPGSTTITAKFKVETGGGGSGTGTWVNRSISAIPL